MRVDIFSYPLTFGYFDMCTTYNTHAYIFGMPKVLFVRLYHKGTSNFDERALKRRLYFHFRIRERTRFHFTAEDCLCRPKKRQSKQPYIKSINKYCINKWKLIRQTLA